jgi:DNA-binding MarR family transcriptional regulator
MAVARAGPELSERDARQPGFPTAEVDTDTDGCDLGPLIDEALTLRLALVRLSRRTRAECDRLGLTPQLYLLLLILAADDQRRPVAELAAVVGIRQPAMSELLKRAVDAHLIERHRLDQDHRRARFVLTEPGRLALAEAVRSLHADRVALVADLGPLLTDGHHPDALSPRVTNGGRP